MAGIYIHIPFCKKKCTYCDFYTVVSPTFIPPLIDAIIKEIDIRKDYLNKETVKTIYFGGGTPSILNFDQFEKIFSKIYELFEVDENAEITFEANPDDLSIHFFETIKSLPFNRISIGIQSFDDEDLKRINRRHTSFEAITAIKNAQNAGFKNISIDLIYGLPFQTLNSWQIQLETAFNLGIQHISSYGLTYEPGTVLWKQREKGLIKVVDDDTMNEMHDLLMRKVKQYNFEAYEISNFSLPNFRSRHNTSYWEQKPYLGIGPSAHSYDLFTRQWNISSIKDYIKAIEENTSFFELEKLTINNRYNDYVMVALRTLEGIDLNLIETQFGTEFREFCLRNIKKYIDSDMVEKSNNKLSLTNKGIQISNIILVALMKV